MSSYNIDLKDCIRTVPNFPIPGIQFRDITSLIENPSAFNKSLLDLTSLTMSFGATKVVGIESRGFVFGTPVARDLDLPFIMARKPGKLPNPTHKRDFDLEYGSTSLEIQKVTDINEYDKVVIVDDLIATGGTAIACADLVHECFDVPKENILILAVIDLPSLEGSAIIEKHGYSVNTLIEFEGE
jgi:adenine phosphoribosyltransferase|tara:strand:+ start:1670 stop:2224 length:555 start_codon:yes stop_codon:yes gene_type:complete